MEKMHKYQVKLEEEKTTLEAELQTVGRRNPSNPADWEPVPTDTGLEADESDRADLIEEFGNNTAILKDLEIRYNEVLAALERIEDGTYGICKIGGEKIEEARLSADATAQSCLAHINA